MDYSKKKTVEDIDVAGKKVLVRCDFNVPLDENGNITDTKRIDEAMKTINYLVSHNAKVILCSHLGRPKGEARSSRERFDPTAERWDSTGPHMYVAARSPPAGARRSDRV